MTVVFSIAEESDDRSVSVFTTWGGEPEGMGGAAVTLTPRSPIRYSVGGRHTTPEHSDEQPFSLPDLLSGFGPTWDSVRLNNKAIVGRKWSISEG